MHAPRDKCCFVCCTSLSSVYTKRTPPPSGARHLNLGATNSCSCLAAPPESLAVATHGWVCVAAAGVVLRVWRLLKQGGGGGVRNRPRLMTYGNLTRRTTAPVKFDCGGSTLRS